MFLTLSCACTREWKDVYAGCNIDYAGKSITPQTFSAVLAGNETVVAKQCAKAGANDCRSGKKVLKSGPNDNVFVNFVDHGGSRIIGFPEGSKPDTMTASALIKTLKAMQRKRMYNKLTFYMEACNRYSAAETCAHVLSVAPRTSLTLHTPPS